MGFKTFENLLTEGVDFRSYGKFFIELTQYQSNHYGSYPTEDLYAAYGELPEDFRKATQVSKKKQVLCYRGADSQTDKPVMSFTWNIKPETAYNNAGFYGHYVFHFSDLASHEATFDPDKIIKYFGKKVWYQISDIYGIGTDENEILVFGGKWKKEQ